MTSFKLNAPAVVLAASMAVSLGACAHDGDWRDRSDRPAEPGLVAASTAADADEPAGDPTPVFFVVDDGFTDPLPLDWPPRDPGDGTDD